DRYFVERLATKIIEISHGEAIVYPGTYKEFLWHKEHPLEELQKGRIAGLQKGLKKGSQPGRQKGSQHEGHKGSPHEGQKGSEKGLSAPRHGDDKPAPGATSRGSAPPTDHAEKKRMDAALRKRERAVQARQAEIGALEK